MTKDIKNDVIVNDPPKKKKKKIRSLERRRAKVGWMFVLPFVIGFAIIYLPMIFQSLRYSFSEIKKIGAVEIWQFAGLDNYSDAILSDQVFVQTLSAGLGQLALQIPAILMFSLFMAVLLNQKMAGRALFRAILFIPVILSTGLMDSLSVTDGALADRMDSAEGMDDGSGAGGAASIVNALDIQQLLAGMKIGSELVTFVVNIINNIYDIINRSGVQLLIFLAGLQSISPAIYESCQIDGASAWETFWKITFPMISPMILVNGVYTVIDAFTSESNVVMRYITNVYNNQTGVMIPNAEALSSAMSWIYFLIVIVVMLAVFGLFSAFVFYQRRD